jgi:uroporphyrinogen decarboxylase
MTKRDVVKLALEFQRPPYVPWSFKFTQEAREKLQAHFGADDIEPFLGNHVIELGSDIGFFEDLGNDRFRDVFGVVWDRTVDKDIGNVEGQVLPDPTLRGYKFPDPLDRRFFDDIPAKLARYGDRFRLYDIGFSLFERAWTLRGMENLFMDFHEHPQFVRDLLDAIADYNNAQVREAVRRDIDAIYFGDDWGQQHGLLMGYPRWREFIYPMLQRMYRAVLDAGKIVFIHSCGDVDELFPDLIAAGLRCFNPFQPEVMDVLALKRAYHGRLAFWGGLSTQRTLPYGTVEQVRAETQRLLDAGTDGGLVLSPAHSVEGDVPLENMLAFIETAQNQTGWLAQTA